MEKPIVLLYQNDNHRGPGKVVKNLKLGLQKKNIVFGNQELLTKKIDSHIGMLQVINNWEKWSTNSLVGPNLFVLPRENVAFSKHFKHFNVPSEWVLNLYRGFSELDHAKIDIWSVGIDTERWFIENRNLDNLKCLLYFKNRTLQDLHVVKKILQKYNIEYKELHYGSYSENELYETCKWANFGILLTNTESQGIAYMEILSTDLPCFVFNKPTWNYDGAYKTVEATSVPYFDENCGEIVENINLIKFEEFLNNVKNKKYSPRQFILKNHSLEISAEKYYNLFVNKTG